MIFTRAVLSCMSGLIFYITGTNTFDYCTISPDHTMCKFKERTFGPSCGKDPASISTSVGQAVIVHEHNKFRSKVARGMEAAKHCPEGADLRLMHWDDELALIAERWALQCQFDHDTNRKVERFQVGQNAFQMSASSSDKVSEKEIYEGAAAAWYNEIESMTDDIFSGQGSVLTVGHFSQMVWNSSEYLGCAITTWNDGEWYKQLVICDYGPAGNWRGKPLYTKGSACSLCPQDMYCSKQYEGLCTSQNEEIGNSTEHEIDTETDDDDDFTTETDMTTQYDERPTTRKQKGASNFRKKVSPNIMAIVFLLISVGFIE